ncbi:MAG: hypothetical protein A2043_01465 [Candidatus Schekmanbacteria bacterium GWA2_38_9]|uniref:Uncharacterized protein n=1 Tax=Candidatus Schekmanbacteria bacterium RIFCSPLOWO2_12_FULL_38_15 TaxID=1817883 RepID=A0A1F7SC07_9BACT|nr:MAG: hypothetical protein A2043_01465 [Candidatus Schekmanbacteria bacterium GWA2_38_9]OGL48266.1 MAG: hypothetical protein A3H37_02330 [Candidatus Schekmanbacteria bacterium RIFCSPLOWO2_02_FULL_38_14]OGL51305.1 MAG: hypothetical protein A3G31_01000 [Candidatus Schekmanbacteria bacterium RIFCSPLOWO2_12_FULL_38_15]
MSFFNEQIKQRFGYLPIISGILVLACGIYCMVCWEPVYPLTFYQPDIGITCWLYCSTMNQWIGTINLLAGFLSIIGGILLLTRKKKTGSYLSLISGIATFPAGILGIMAGWSSLKGLIKSNVG